MNRIDESRVEGAVRSLLSLSAALTLLFGCASHPPERATTATGPTGTAGGQTTSHVRSDLGCTDVEPTGEAAKFVEFTLSDEGQKIVRKVGFVPVRKLN